MGDVNVKITELILCGITAAFFLTSMMLALNLELILAVSFFAGGTLGVFAIEELSEEER